MTEKKTNWKGVSVSKDMSDDSIYLVEYDKEQMYPSVALVQVVNLCSKRLDSLHKSVDCVNVFIRQLIRHLLSYVDIFKNRCNAFHNLLKIV